MLWVSLAIAAPLLVDPDVNRDEAAASVQSAAGIEDLQVMGLEELLGARPPLLSGDGQVDLCTRAPSSAGQVSEQLGKAEDSVSYMDYEAALSELDEVDGLLACLRDPVSPADAARAYFLRGIVAFDSGDEGKALQSFVQARQFDPEIAWDTAFPPRAQGVFDQATTISAEQAPASLLLVPAPPDIRVDGRLASTTGSQLTLGPGRHLVQLGPEPMTTFQVELQAGSEATLVVPAMVDEHALREIATDDRVALSAALGALLGEGQLVFVAVPGGIWKGSAGGRAWEQIVATEPVAIAEIIEVPAPELEPGDKGVRRGLLGVAIGTAAVSGALYGGAALTNQAFYASDTPTGQLEQVQQLNNGLIVASAGLGAVAVGLGVVAVF